MSGRPFLSHADMPTPSAPARPSFVPALRLGGPAPAAVRSNASMQPPRPAVVSVPKPAPAASAFGGGGGGGGGAARMAFKPAGGSHDGSNVYIYRPPTNLYRPGPSPPPAQPAAGASPSPPAPAGSPPASGITRGPPSAGGATDSKMLGGPGRDYQMPSKASYTPFGPRNAPYAQQAAGGRPLTNAFRVPTSIPNIRATVRVARPKRRPKARASPTKKEGEDGEAADDEAAEDEEVWDPDAPDDESETLTLAPSLRGKKTGRPSSAFRGASPRAPPPEAFEPDWAGLGQVMTVTSRNKLPGARKHAGSKGSSQSASKAPSVASTARSTAAKLPIAKVEHDPDDPFAEDAGDGAEAAAAAEDGAAEPAGDEADEQLEQGDANAREHESPRSQRSAASHASARSHISKASQHSAGWYTRQFHLTGDLAKDMLILQERAAALQAQVMAEKEAAGKEEEEEKEQQPQQQEEEEEEVFAQDGEVNPEEEAGDEEPLDDEAQAEADEEFAAAQAEEEAARADEALVSSDNAEASPAEEDVDQDHAGEEDPQEMSQSEEFQPDDLEEQQEEEEEAGEKDLNRKKEAKAPAASAPGDPPRKVLRPSNAWAQREPLVSPPQLYTSQQWGTQTRKDMAALRTAGGKRDGNETSDIDTEIDTEAEQEEKSEAEAKGEDEDDSGSDTDPFASSGDDHSAAAADLGATALFVVQGGTLRPSPGSTLLSTAAFGAAQVPPSDSEDEGPATVPSKVLTTTGSAKNLFANIMQQVNKKAQETILSKPLTPKTLKKNPLAGNESKKESTEEKSSNASAETPPTAASATSSSADPAPVVDYVAVLKKKGVAPVLERDRAKVQEANEALAMIREHEKTLAALRAREKELMQLKWHQVQAAEQASARSNKSDPFASPPMSPQAVNTNRSNVSVTIPSSTSAAEPDASPVSPSPPANPSLSHSHSLKAFAKSIVNVRHAMAPQSPVNRRQEHQEEEEAKQEEEEELQPPQAEEENAEIPSEPEHDDSFVSESGVAENVADDGEDQVAAASMSEIPPSDRDPFASDHEDACQSPKEDVEHTAEEEIGDQPEYSEVEQSQNEFDLSASVDELVIQPLKKQPKPTAPVTAATASADHGSLSDDDPFANM